MLTAAHEETRASARYRVHGEHKSHSGKIRATSTLTPALNQSIYPSCSTYMYRQSAHFFWILLCAECTAERDFSKRLAPAGSFRLCFCLLLELREISSESVPIAAIESTHSQKHKCVRNSVGKCCPIWRERDRKFRKNCQDYSIYSSTDDTVPHFSSGDHSAISNAYVHGAVAHACFEVQASGYLSVMFWTEYWSRYQRQ